MVIRYFDIDETPCKLFAPDADGVKLVVLAVHGFAGDKESSAIEALAERLCSDNAAVLCFDFPAHGAHPSDDLTLAACDKALLGAARYIQVRYPTARKAVFATSFGGYMTLRCLDGLSAVFGRFAPVLRAPAVKMARTFESLLGRDGLAQLEETGAIEVGFQRKIVVKRQFLDELRACDVCKTYSMPMMVIHGDKDDVVPLADIEDFLAKNPLATYVRIPGADHRFKGEGELDQVVRAAVGYYFAFGDV